jgi:hypothetical protein
MPNHIKNLGICALCRQEVLSVMDLKEHVMGDVNKNGLIGWSEGKDLSPL